MYWIFCLDPPIGLFQTPAETTLHSVAEVAAVWRVGQLIFDEHRLGRQGHALDELLDRQLIDVTQARLLKDRLIERIA